MIIEVKSRSISWVGCLRNGVSVRSVVRFDGERARDGVVGSVSVRDRLSRSLGSARYPVWQVPAASRERFSERSGRSANLQSGVLTSRRWARSTSSDSQCQQPSCRWIIRIARSRPSGYFLYHQLPHFQFRFILVFRSLYYHFPFPPPVFTETSSLVVPQCRFDFCNLFLSSTSSPYYNFDSFSFLFWPPSVPFYKTPYLQYSSSSYVILIILLSDEKYYWNILLVLIAQKIV